MASVAVKRFYDRVGVRCAAKAEYLVTLDGRDLRTPAKKAAFEKAVEKLDRLRRAPAGSAEPL